MVRVYSICLDAFPLSDRLVEMMLSKGFQRIEHVCGGAFTTPTLNSMFMGTTPWDLVPGGITYHTLKLNKFYTWREEKPGISLFDVCEENGVQVHFHNNLPWMVRNVMHVKFDHKSHYREETSSDALHALSSSKYSSKVRVTANNPDGSLNVFREYKNKAKCNEFYTMEQKFIQEKQAENPGNNEIFFTDWCDWHDSLYYTDLKFKEAVVERAYQWLNFWDFDEPDSFFWIFADHGDAVTENIPPKDFVTWLFVKDNRAKKIPIQRPIVASYDFYATCLELFGIPFDCRKTFQLSESIFSPVSKDRIYYIQDSRAREKGPECIVLSACKVTFHEEADIPKYLTQVTYKRRSLWLGYQWSFETRKCKQIPLHSKITVELKEKVLKKYT